MRSELARYASYLVFVVVALATLRLLGHVLAPFLGAAILAYVFVPLVDRLERRGVPRTLGVVLVFGVILASLFGLLLVLVPLVERQVSSLLQGLPAALDWLRTRALPWVSTAMGTEVVLDSEALKASLMERLKGNGGVLAQWLGSVTFEGLALLGTLATVALVPLVLFYFLRDWPTLLGAIADLVPRRHLAAVSAVAKQVDGVLGEFLRGQLAVMAALGFYYTVALRLAGLDSALSIGVLTGLFAFVPYLGFSLGMVLSIFASFTQNHGAAGLLPVAAIYGVGQVLEGYVLTPWLVGERIGLHPVVVILSILAFGQLLGFVGVLLALPLAASCLVLLRHLRGRYHASGLYRE